MLVVVQADRRADVGTGPVGNDVDGSGGDNDARPGRGLITISRGRAARQTTSTASECSGARHGLRAH